MQREGKKRMMPRHLLTAAVISGVVPRNKVTEKMLTRDELQRLDDLLRKRKEDGGKV